MPKINKIGQCFTSYSNNKSGMFFLLRLYVLHIDAVAVTQF